MKNIHCLLLAGLLGISTLRGQNTAITSTPVKFTGSTFAINWQDGTPIPKPTLTVDGSLNLNLYHEVPNSRMHYVQLRVDDLNNMSAPVFTKRFRIKAFVDVYFQSTPVTDTIRNIELTVDHRPESGTVFRDFDIYKIAVPPTSNGNKIFVNLKSIEIYKWTTATDSVKITSPADPEIVNVPNNYTSWYLDAWTELERYTKLDPAAAFTAASVSPDLLNNTLTTDTLRITWTTVTGAQEYDIEWTYVDNYKANASNAIDSVPYTALRYNFAKNSTRVRIPAQAPNQYTIPVVYERGWLLVRVRGVGRNPADLSKAYFGNWSETADAGTVNSFIQKYKITSPHQSDGLNWQIVTNYAEQGKKTDLLTYYDGTMRRRQNVARSYEFSYATVSDQLYDYEGRPAVQMLPAPVNDVKLKFYPNLNGTAAAPYTKANFEKFNATACAIVPDTVVNASTGLQGAGQYFSAQNFNIASPGAPYAPQSFGYPFLQVEYTKDNTGRIRRHGSPGRDHRLGSGHETKYYYGVPSQTELDRLFGNDVGDAIHYKKNMVIDANGQASVSYLDLKGQVIATALAGDSPAGLDTINPRNVSLTENLLDFSTLDSTNQSLIAQKNILVPSPGTYSFTYTVQPPQFNTSNCHSLCYDCIYDLTIKITKDETCSNCSGAEVWSATQTIGQLYTASGSVDATCTISLPVTVNSPALSLGVGSYTVTKILKINEPAADAYALHFTLDTCNLWNTIVTQEMSKMDFSNCDIFCTDCVDELAAYKANPNEITINDLFNCANTNDCDTTSLNMCEVAYDAMLDDVSPGGQYATMSLDTTVGGTYYSYFADNHPVSILNKTTGNKFPTILINGVTARRDWTHGGLQYKDENGQAISVVIDGVSKTVNQLTLQEFMENFQPVWARTLVRLHPEYCQWYWCSGTANTAYEQMSAMTRSATYALAGNAGYLDLPSFGSDAFIYSNTTRWNDLVTAFRKYFNIPLNSNTYPFSSPTTYSSWGANKANDALFINNTLKRAAAAVAARCNAGDQAALTNCINAAPFGGTMLSTAQRNEQWEAFRAFYTALKNEVLYKEGVAYAINNNCYNGCIGTMPFQYTQNNFTTSYQTNPAQPCYNTTAGYFASKRKAFPSINDMDALNDANINLYTASNPMSYLVNGGVVDLEIDTLVLEFCGECPGGQAAVTGPELGGFLNGAVKDAKWFADSDCNKIYGPAPGGSVVDISSQAFVTGQFVSLLNPMYVGLCDTTAFGFFGKDTLAGGTPGQFFSIGHWPLSKTNGLPYAWHQVLSIDSTFAIPAQQATIHASFGQVKPGYQYFQVKASVDLGSGTVSTEDMEVGIMESLAAPPAWCPVPWVNNLNDCITITDTLQLASPLTPYGPILQTQNSAIQGCNICNETPPPPVTIDNPCVNYLISIARGNARIRYERIRDSLLTISRSAYYAKCRKPLQESFTATYADKLYHYTLYYYDQAGNLVKTIPPNGIYYGLFTGTAAALDTLNRIRQHRANNHYPAAGGNSVPPAYYPWHSVPTYTQYNCLDQPTYQYSPDAGGARLVYDEVRRLVRSFNANQKRKRFTYTLFDYLNRVAETGESAYTTDLDTLFTFTNYAAHKTLVNGGIKSQITRSWYDKPLTSTINGYFGAAGQENLRGRVSTTMYSPANGTANGMPTFEQATHYSYDIRGNVTTLIQDHSTFGQKRIEYDYELISGNVRAVYYQKNRWDQFVHYYSYDKDNRLKWVQTALFPSSITSSPGPRDQDAQYFYYKHGPLMRTEVGMHRVQGLDYAYTIHGWLKGVNSGALKSTSGDIGKDGQAGGANAPVARDAFGYVLGYYGNGTQNDYHPIGNATTAPRFDPTGYTVSNATSLYNGNIPQMITATREPGSMNFRAHRTAYRYDQLHRFKQQSHYDWTATAFNTTATSEYFLSATYDYAGNIKTLTRNGNTANLTMDVLTYKYTDAKKPNRLRYIDDMVSTLYADDLEDQAPGNYSYDNIGNLIGDASEGGKTITWNAYNKITFVSMNSATKSLAFGYDAAGNRVRKDYSVLGVTTTHWYVRDAQGNILSVYKKAGTSAWKQDAVYLYGIGRVGELALRRDSAIAWNRHYFRVKGNRHYELANHLGNVLAVVTDRKIGQDTTADAFKTPQYYLPDIYSVQNYYPFGQNMPGWSTSSLNDPTRYRFGFNGKEDDDEWVKQDYGFRIHDPRVGRFLSVDPLRKEYPWYTPYQFAGNMPIWAADLDGLEPDFKGSDGVVEAATDKTNGSTYTWVWGHGIWNRGTKETIVSTAATPWIKHAGGQEVFEIARAYIYNEKIKSQIGSPLGRALGGAPSSFREEAWEKSKYLANATLKSIWFEALEKEEFPNIDGYWLFGESVASGIIKMKYGTTSTDQLEGICNMGMAASDVFLVRSLTKLGVKGIAALVRKSGLEEIGTKAIHVGQQEMGVHSKILNFTYRQLQSKFKHAIDFGISGDYSKANISKFSAAISQHINSPTIRVIEGTYRGQSAIHYLNTETGLNVISHPNGQFWSGWKLSTKQLNYILEYGALK